MMDKGTLRAILWATLTSSVMVVLYRPYATALISKAVGMLSGDLGYVSSLGGIFLVLFFLFLRWEELKRVALQEQGVTMMVYLRLSGVIVMLSPFMVMRSLDSLPFYQYLHASAMTVLLVGYGASLLVYPSTWKFLLPYTVLSVLSLLSPTLIQMFLGDYMVGISANLTKFFLDIPGIVVFWDGNVASFASKTGESFRLVIDAGCSSIPAISIFLLLSGLMHLDQKKDLLSTIKLASFGTLSLILLNSLKVSIVIWAGKAYGAKALWSLHSWLGYVFFSMFYLVTLLVDLRLRFPKEVQSEG